MERKISVIIPIYNKEKYLSTCLESLRQQTFKDIQVIMIDDGSTDKSKEICNKFLKLDSRFEYYFYKNSGCSKSRNRGLEKSRGEFIIFVDSDDYLKNDFCEKFYKKYIESTADLLISDIQIVNESASFEKKISERINKKSNFLSKNKIWRNSASNKMFKKNIIEKYGLKFCENSHSWEDMGFVLKYFSLINKIDVVTDTEYYYYRNLNSVTLNKDISSKKIEQRFNVINDTYGFLKKNSLDEKNFGLIEKILIREILIRGFYALIYKIENKHIQKKYINQYQEQLQNYSVYINKYTKLYEKIIKIFYKLLIFFRNKGVVK